MPIADVWRDIGREIEVYTGTRLQRVPAVEGVYAWFYPLLLTTYDLASLVKEVHQVMFFDPAVQGLPNRTVQMPFYWRNLDVSVREQPKHWGGFGGGKAQAWANICDNPDAFDSFRRSLLKASILLPPLYVGKATNLYVRCTQHVNGGDGNTFHNRYERFAARANLTAKQVRQLVFACIRTDTLPVAEGPQGVVAELLEDILKTLSRPSFGLK
jgi:hypothetical protein